MPAYAPVISIKVDSDAPSAMAGPRARSAEMPKFDATLRTFSRPTASDKRTAGIFSD